VAESDPPASTGVAVSSQVSTPAMSLKTFISISPVDQPKRACQLRQSLGVTVVGRSKTTCTIHDR
jgi:hypothetical protein